MRTRILLLVLWLAPLGATTLEQLSMSDMIAKSTAIVRAKVTGSYAAYRGSDIYTHYRLEVLETLKGSAVLDVAIPGGVLNGRRQTVAGAPVLTPGTEYVLFLWTGRSGMTQVIGLSQGLFGVQKNAAGEQILVRSAATELMVDSEGRVVRDSAVALGLAELRSRVRGGR